MGNRSPRHLKPGDVNLKGKREKTVCPCCDPVIDHRAKILERLAREDAELFEYDQHIPKHES